MTIEKLTTLFRKLGARDPEQWARSQVDRGIDQVARYVFLRQAWKSVVPPGDASWIDAQVASANARCAARRSARGAAR